MKIRQAKEQSIVQKFGGYRMFVERECEMRWGVSANWEIGSGKPLHAVILNSNWAVMCDTCKESFVIDLGEPYFCPNCLNAGYDGKARRVIFPDTNEMDEIKRLLVLRPNPGNRNWLGESVDELKRENIEHGVEV